MDNLHEGLTYKLGTEFQPALRRICERAFLIDPERTASDLNLMGLRDFANELAQDHRMGRLQANLATLEPGPLDRLTHHG